MESLPLSVLIVNYNSGDHLRACIDSLRAQQDLAFECIVVDNASTDASLDGIDGQLPALVIERGEENVGFAAAINRAAQRATGEWLLLLNPDCTLKPDALKTSLALARAWPNLGLAGAWVCESDGRVQRATLRQLPTPLSLLREWLKPSGSTARSADSVEPVAALNGAFLWIARTRFDALGGLDAGYFLHFEDLDLIARVRASGAPIVRFNPVEVRHAKGASDAPTVAVEAAKAASMRRYFARHTPHAFGARWVPWLARLRVRVCAARWARADARR